MIYGFILAHLKTKHLVNGSNRNRRKAVKSNQVLIGNQEIMSCAKFIGPKVALAILLSLMKKDMVYGFTVDIHLISHIFPVLDLEVDMVHKAVQELDSLHIHHILTI